jgi:hypothetical protein
MREFFGYMYGYTIGCIGEGICDCELLGIATVLRCFHGDHHLCPALESELEDPSSNNNLNPNVVELFIDELAHSMLTTIITNK